MVRIGDDDRTACAGALAEAVATGHLSLAECDDRLSRAASALTAADISELLHDLPPAAQLEPRARRSHSVSVVALRVTTFQFLLVLLSFALSVDLESDLRGALTIFLEIWMVGTLSGAAGYFMAHRHQRHPRPGMIR